MCEAYVIYEHVLLILSMWAKFYYVDVFTVLVLDVDSPTSEVGPTFPLFPRLWANCDFTLQSSAHFPLYSVVVLHTS
jgi:hypothetical protein